MKFITYLLCVGAALAFVQCQDMQEKMKAIKEACQAETNASDDDIKAYTQNLPLTTTEGKCYHACFMKKIEVLNESGKLDAVKTKAFVSTLSQGNELATFVDIIDNCAPIEVDADHCEAAAQYTDRITTMAKDKGVKLPNL
uniref:Pheromone binding protein-related protein 2 n=1 Tax=Liriomyza sativae TaxID=127406 RepID=A0A109PMX0_LIRSA|nr:pheromone binding protein-related protein 2 [Liriomyza sativae]